MSTDLSCTPGQPLAEAIAIATRPIHARLNKLIISRLPLALPPRAANAAVYTSGLLHVAPIYTTFESVWQTIIDTPPSHPQQDSTPAGCDVGIPLLDTGSILWPREEAKPDSLNSSVCNRMHSVLENIYLPGLMRTDRLKADIQALTGWPDHVMDEQLKQVSEAGPLGDFLHHIKNTIQGKPHALLAYSYILFMALFAGGRFIGASLESAGEEFWEQGPSPVMPTLQPCARGNMEKSEAIHISESVDLKSGVAPNLTSAMPLRFFHFPTPMDGEDLKRDFKQRLSESEAILTAQEKTEIVQESVSIFEHMLLLVSQLDAVCANYKPVEGLPTYPLASFLKDSFTSRLRDSVAVAKERSGRFAKKFSFSEDSGLANTRPRESRLSDYAATPTAAIPGRGFHRHDTANMSVADTGLCPGLAKSMRFEKALLHPREQASPDADDRVEILKQASGVLLTGNMTNWAVMAVVGVFIFGAFLTGRRAVVAP